MDSDYLHTLHGQSERGANGRVRAIGLFVADKFPQEAFARVADEQRAAEFVEFVAVTHQRDVVLMCFAETNAGVETDPLARNAGGHQCVATGV